MAFESRAGGNANVSTDELRAEVERIAGSEPFRRSERAKRFLRAAGEASVSGGAGAGTEAAFAREVFDREGDFDPKIDSLVRVEAGRVRAKLAQYYGEEGAGSALRIRLPKGSYALEAERATERDPGPRRLLISLGAALAACAALTGWLLMRG